MSSTACVQCGPLAGPQCRLRVHECTMNQTPKTQPANSYQLVRRKRRVRPLNSTAAALPLGRLRRRISEQLDASAHDVARQPHLVPATVLCSSCQHRSHRAIRTFAGVVMLLLEHGHQLADHGLGRWRRCCFSPGATSSSACAASSSASSSSVGCRAVLCIPRDTPCRRAAAAGSEDSSVARWVSRVQPAPLCSRRV